ncbi:MAG: hypothetical protein ACI9BW_000967 [Gammaproteobacteria bacterium]|jgi:hypothetical protein
MSLMNYWKISSTALMLLISIGAHAEQISGRELLAACNDSKGPAAKQYCVGYITAAIETHATWALWRRLERVFCFPEGDKFEHAFGGVVEYLRAHPEQLDFEASSLVLTSINERFACE